MDLYNKINDLPRINESTLKVGDYLVEAYSGFSDSQIYEFTELNSDFFIAKIVGLVDKNGIYNNHYKFYDGENYFDFSYDTDFFTVIPKEYHLMIKKVLIFS